MVFFSLAFSISLAVILSDTSCMLACIFILVVINCGNVGVSDMLFLCTMIAQVDVSALTCCHCSCKVKAYSFRQFQGLLKVVDLCSWELCRNIAGGTSEDRVDKVFFLKEHTPVVRAFPSVVKREDAWEFLGPKVCACCLSTYGVIFMG